MSRFLVLLILSIIPLFASQTKISYFNDYNKSYSITQVIKGNETLFTKILSAKNAKFSENAQVWLKIEQNNTSDTNYKSVLKFLDIRLDKMSVYSQNAELLSESGDRVPFVNREYEDAQIAINIDTNADSTSSTYIKFTNEDKSDLTYKMYEKKEYLEEFLSKKIIQSFFFGALLIMLLYNFIFYLFLREKTFGIYILYHIILFVVMLYYNGVIIQYYYPTEYNNNGGNVPALAIYLSIIFGMEFLRNFLNVKEHTPRLNKYLLIFILLSIVLMLLHPFGIIYQQLPSLIMVPLSLFLLFISAYHSFVLKSKIALFFLFGWLVMLLSIILTGMLSFGFLQRNDFTSNIFQVGIVIEITLLSMGLAYRYKISQDELVKKTKFIHEQSKLASMGEMLGHISHQWRQPLSEINSVAMKIETDFKKNRLSAVSLDKHIEKIEDVTEHMSETIDSFNGYFKSDKRQTLVSLEDVVNKTLSLVQESFLKSDVKVQKIVDSQEKIEIVESELVQVLLVLLNNAREAFKSSHKGIKVVTIRIKKEKKKHIITIEDNAGGIELENISKVFEPYYTSKFESNGIGIGLYMAKMLVEESLKGSLLADNSESGAIFSIKL